MRGLLALAAITTTNGAPVTAHASAYGRILFDTRGYVLYSFTADTNGKSACHGTCAKRWPPYVRNGRQVVFKNHPLYYYVGDRKPGQILCQNAREFGGLWLVVRPNGTPVR